MQHKSGRTAVRELPAIWGGFLVGHLRTDLDTLNRTLIMRPNGQPFELLKNPTPHPKRGARPVFQRVVEQGHWPDQGNYTEYWADGKKYNLFERVDIHLPGSGDFLFRDLQRPALELPHDQHDIQDRIANCLDRFGLARLRTAASFLVVQVVLNSVSAADASRYMGGLFRPALGFLASAGEPLHTTILTLLRQEEVCLRVGSIEDDLKAYCVRGWTNLLRRPELRYDHALFRKSLHAVKGLLAGIEHARIVGPMPAPTSVAQTMMPICPIWQPTPERLQAELTLCHFYWDLMLGGNETRHRRPLAPRELRTLPAEIEEAVQVVFTGIRAADSCWGEWRRSSSTRKPSEKLEVPVPQM